MIGASRVAIDAVAGFGGSAAVFVGMAAGVACPSWAEVERGVAGAGAAAGAGAGAAAGAGADVGPGAIADVDVGAGVGVAAEAVTVRTSNSARLAGRGGAGVASVAGGVREAGTREAPGVEAEALASMRSARGCMAVFQRAREAMRNPDAGTEAGTHGEAGAGGDVMGSAAGALAPSMPPAIASRQGSIRGTCLSLGRYASAPDRCSAAASPAGLESSRQSSGDAGRPSW